MELDAILSLLLSLDSDCTFYDAYYQHEVRLSALYKLSFATVNQAATINRFRVTGDAHAAHPRSLRFIGKQKSILECRCSIAAADSSKRRSK